MEFTDMQNCTDGELVKCVSERFCVWTFDEEDHRNGRLDFYKTQCGDNWCTSGGCTPEEDGIKFCPFCGGKVEVKNA